MGCASKRKPQQRVLESSNATFESGRKKNSMVLFGRPCKSIVVGKLSAQLHWECPIRTCGKAPITCPHSTEVGTHRFCIMLYGCACKRMISFEDTAVQKLEHKLRRNTISLPRYTPSPHHREICSLDPVDLYGWGS